MTAIRLLVAGAGGMLGRDVADAASASGLEVVALTRSELDIVDAQAVADAVGEAKPEMVINCAAWTDVDGAEGAFAQALAVNGPGAGNVARAATAAGAWTIHISSDYVFDGTKREPYVESDPTNPLSVYGRSKLAGELEVAGHAPGRHTVVRSSWLYGVHGRCFPATILRLAAERDQLAVVDDQVGCPTFTRHLARGLVDLAQGSLPVGTLHLAGSGSCSWFELAARVVELAGLDCQITPAQTADVPWPAPRPANSMLASERDERPALPHWHQGLEEFLAVRVP
jgi:dTDP-4-dehydrorhamnose reductase